MTTPGRQMKRKQPEAKADSKVFDFTEEDGKKEHSGSEDDVREGASSASWR